jgi:SPP1 gp7 family putative phage head morphogenesis protein
MLAAVVRFRAALLRRDADATHAVMAAYVVAQRAIRRDLDALTERIAEAQENGEPMSPSWLFRQDRYYRLQQQVDAAMRQLTSDGGNVIMQAQRTEAEYGMVNAYDLMRTGLGDAPVGVGVNFATLPADAMTELVGTLQPGSPLRGLLDGFGAEVSAAVRDALVDGIALGLGPNQVASAVRRAMGGEAWKARRLARNEIMRSYRNAALATYRANDRYVRAWQWMSTRSRRTCAACWAKHGQIFPLTTPFSGHVQCRCTPVPVTRSWRELGFDVPSAEPADIGRGPDLFARLSAADQAFVLGPEKYALYRDGAIGLEDTVATRRSRQWGASYTVATTDEALANAAQRERRAA